MKGPITGIVAVLSEARWTARSPVQWDDTSGGTWHLANANHTKAIEEAIAGALEAVEWEEAANSRLGAGLEEGGWAHVIHKIAARSSEATNNLCTS